LISPQRLAASLAERWGPPQKVQEREGDRIQRWRDVDCLVGAQVSLPLPDHGDAGVMVMLKRVTFDDDLAERRREAAAAPPAD
jgi:hypothetical protein